MDNRAVILFIALQLFATRGYDAIGVQEIVDKAGVTKPTLYHYFGSKSGLLEAILNEYGERFSMAISKASAYQGDLSLVLEYLGKTYFQFAKENSMFYRMQLAMYFAPPESEQNRMIRRQYEIQLHFVEELFIQAAKHHGKLKGRHLVLAATFIGAINTYIGFAMNNYIELREEQVNQVVHQFMYGIYS